MSKPDTTPERRSKPEDMPLCRLRPFRRPFDEADLRALLAIYPHGSRVALVSPGPKGGQ